MRGTALIAFLLGTAATTAQADWSGGYIGGQLGYAYSEFDLNVSDFDGDSVIGGFTAGYLWDLGASWYVGPEFQYDWADISVTDPDTGDSADFNEIARLKVIVGYELASGGLMYGSVGYAYASFDGVDTFFDGSSDSYVLGLGYSWMVNDNWALGAEYLYHSFDGIGDGGGDVDVNAIYFKAVYRF
ncbi:outer membrane protein [Albibacillus kandeliae]|uniref:outer membrane protein n=1 Tax=Albibacillus kandeliae TaxID=2174228 RepID=UPI0013008C8C|nr:outer membrane beta-barrel protein [Albibacillus kandeliae]